MSLSLQCLAGIKVCQGLFLTATFKSPRQQWGHHQATDAVCAPGTPWKSLSDPTSLRPTYKYSVLSHQSTGARAANANTHLSQWYVWQWPSAGSYVSQSQWLEGGYCPWAGHSAGAWNLSKKHEGSQDKGSGSCFQVCWLPLGPCQQHNSLCSLKTPIPPRTLRKDSYGLLTISMTKVLSSEIFISCWKPVIWPL